MSENNDNTNGTARLATAATLAAAERPTLDIALSQIEMIKGEFRNSIAGLSKLADLLKQVGREQRVSEKEVQTVRQTLRSLQGVRI